MSVTSDIRCRMAEYCRIAAMLLCYRKNGGPLPGKEGPLRVVVADEKRHARWVRQVTAIELGRVEEPSPAR